MKSYPENVIFQAPAGWRDKLKTIARGQLLPSYSYLIRRELAEKYPELKNQDEA